MMTTLLAAAFLTGLIGSGSFVFFTGIFARWHAPDRAPRARSALAWWIRETVANLAVLPMLAFGVMPAGRPRPGLGANDRIPVLLVHGYDMNRATMWPLAWYLKRRGWRWAHSVNHGPWGNPIAAHARHLAERIAELKRVSGAPKVDIVAHSMGGIIAAWYVARMDGHADVRRIVSIGTPWQGTRTAYFGRRAEARHGAREHNSGRHFVAPRARDLNLDAHRPDCGPCPEQRDTRREGRSD
jgi:triacylglycerol esterase/lipase EstA (alpha/beta hydrolase family)